MKIIIVAILALLIPFCALAQNPLLDNQVKLAKGLKQAKERDTKLAKGLARITDAENKHAHDWTARMATWRLAWAIFEAAGNDEAEAKKMATSFVKFPKQNEGGIRNALRKIATPVPSISEHRVREIAKREADATLSLARQYADNKINPEAIGIMIGEMVSKAVTKALENNNGHVQTVIQQAIDDLNLDGKLAQKASKVEVEDLGLAVENNSRTLSDHAQRIRNNERTLIMVARYKARKEVLYPYLSGLSKLGFSMDSLGLTPEDLGAKNKEDAQGMFNKYGTLSREEVSKFFE